MNPVIGIEAGGSKWVLAWGMGPDALYDRLEIPTETPDITIPKVIDYIQQVQRTEKIASVGLALFGPCDIDPLSPGFGCILDSPKLPWNHFNVVDAIQSTCSVDVFLTTDVNAAALGEGRWGAARDVSDYIYLTVGTGIGGAIVVNGELLYNNKHPEMGHVLVRSYEGDDFKGICPYHSYCLEGMASGPAMKKRWNVASALELEQAHPAWDSEAYYLAQGLMAYTLTYVPQRIILGGGVMRQHHLLEKIETHFYSLLNNYVHYADLKSDRYVVMPELAGNAGVCGALLLALSSNKKEGV